MQNEGNILAGLSEQTLEFISVKRKAVHRMTLEEVAKEINSLLGTLDRYQPIETQHDCRNFKRYNVWYGVKNVTMISDHPANQPRCAFNCITIPDAKEVEILVQQEDEEDEEFSSFAHSYLVTLRCMLEEFKRKDAATFESEI